MPPTGPCSARGKQEQPALEVANIFRTHGQAYRKSHSLTPEQHQVMWAIENCRTATLGGHVDVCTDCGHERPAYNSCRNRHCPKCQCLAQARWIEQRQQRILLTHYFHVVFTLPHELGPLARCNQKALNDLLFAAASQTLLEFGRRHLRGAQLAVTAVLHTWSRELHYHPHLHCIVAGGGLRKTDESWVSTAENYLFPVETLSQVFRGKYLAALIRAYEQGQLALYGNCAKVADPKTFAKLKDTLYRKDWVVYAKRTFGGPTQVYRYLGSYTHRVGISNQRLRAADDTNVTFATKNGKIVTLSPEEFIRRFLLHVLPKNFVKIRHYGLLASGNATTKLEVARRLLDEGLRRNDPQPDFASSTDNAGADADWRELLEKVSGVDLSRCPRCRRGTMVRYPLAELEHVRKNLSPEPLDSS